MVIDYMWMTGEEEKGTKQEEFRGLPIMTAIWMGAWVVPEKGEHWYAINVSGGTALQ